MSYAFNTSSSARTILGLVAFVVLGFAAPAWAGGADGDCCFPPTITPAVCFADLAKTQPIPCPSQCYVENGVSLPIVCTPNASGVCTQCDCNDHDASISPLSAEVCSDGIDNNCNGLVDADDPACPGGGSCPFTSPSATVAIHVSETTAAQWNSLGGPHADWKPWHIYGFLMEELRSDGTPFDILSDAQITAGALMSGGTPKYAILFSLANDCISNAAAAQIETFVSAGGRAFVGSTSWTRDENCVLRSGGGGGGAIYTPAQVTATAQNFFSASFSPDKTINTNCGNADIWLNAINDLLPTWIQYEFPAAHTISKVVLVHSTYGAVAPPFKYLIRDYEVQVSSNSACGSGVGFVTVATNTGNNVIGEVQETTFAPTSAKCVRVNALYPSYETTPYQTYNTANWIALNAFQAIEDGTGNLLIDHPCATSGTLPNAFALSAEMGLTAGSPIQIGDIKRTGVVDPLVSHLENDAVVRGWKLANSAGASSYNHPTHWAQEVGASSATVLAATGSNKPILAVKGYGAGRFIYHSEFNPLAGYSMHTIANLVYGFYRKAIDEAHSALGLPNVRLGAWPWPNVAGFMTRHDHFSNFGFDGIRGTADDAQVAQIENAHGVRGGYFLRTDTALPVGSDPCLPGFGSTCVAQVRTNVSNMAALGARFGSHTTNESQEPSQANIHASLDRLQAYLGFRPTIFVAPGGSAMRDTTKGGLVAEGIVTEGDIAHGAHPHFALRVDTATEYSDAARWSLVDMPAVGYYGTPASGAFAGGIWAHEITSNPPNCNNDGTVRPCMEKAVDLQYALGGLINLYEHIGDGGLANPTPAQFEQYIVYAQGKGYVYTTDPVDLEDWWRERDPVRVSKSYTTIPLPKVTVDLSCATENQPFSVEVDLPFGAPLVVKVNGSPTTNYVLDGNRIRVSAPAPSQVTIQQGGACATNQDCDDGLACNGAETCNPMTLTCEAGSPPVCSLGGADPQCNDAICAEPTGCVVQPKSNGTACSDGNACTQTDACQSGSCAGTNPVVCAALDQCHVVGTCNPSTGVCSNPNKPDGAACNDGFFCNGGDTCLSGECTVHAGDPCVGGPECGNVCNEAADNCLVASGTECRASAGPCDVAESCDGVNNTCPADAKSTAVCRPAAGDCDVAESCDGVNNACPADAFKANTVECRASGGVCDPAEKCTGSTATCPADAKSTAVCRPVAGDCDVAESCDGVNNTCPANAFLPSSTVCRAANQCTVAEARCTGLSANCPPPTGELDGASCNDGDTCQAGVCTGANTLSVATVRLSRNHDKSGKKPNGSVYVNAIVNDVDTGGTLVTDLQNGRVTLKVRDGGGSGGFSVTLALTNCLVNPRTGSVSCKDPISRMSATSKRIRRHHPQGSDYGMLYKMVVHRTGLGTSDTGSDQPSGPVHVILHQTLVDRPEVMNTCWQSGNDTLVCHD